MPAFPPIPPEVSFPRLEEEVLRLWRDRDVFRRSVEDRPASSAYVFYDGPPFATGLPHYGNLVASTLKDIVPRYWTMRGHRVERRFGWDTHGLPIEMEIEKTLNLSGPRSIREFGVARFNEACRENVLRYTREWQTIIERLGRWADFVNDYKTMDRPFMESVWWVFKELWNKGLVYQDYRVMPFSWRLSTSLSNFEANLDYRDVQDPAITVKLALDGEKDCFLLVWTTTPWTLPSNLAVAVGPELEYVRARRKNDPATYIVLRGRLDESLGKDAEVVATLPGSALLDRGYQPLFPYFADLKDKPHGGGGAFYIVGSSDIKSDEGTGLVHMAPAYGEIDFEICRREKIAVVDPVDEEGRFTAAVTDFAGQNVKEADKNIIRALKEKGAILKHETTVHSYPFCWRSGTPLIYKTVPGWFVRVERLRDRMVAHNDAIHWVPEAVGRKRFGNWLAEARDWNISRNRFWGTPIPVWVCGKCANQTCISSAQELEKRTGTIVPDLHPHKIDHLELKCESCGASMRRISDVFDCWFESGAMPYAQVHYPFERKEQFEHGFPAQFIAEGLDQTRGWFYTLLVLSTALFDSTPFRNVIVNGLVLAEDGSKMSKSKKNYPDPSRVLNEHGADALRACLINSPVVRAEPLRFSENGVREVVRTVLLPLRNAWSFFVQYANVDGWHPRTGFDRVPTPAIEARPGIDRWILSVLQSQVREINEQMEGYYLYKVVPRIMEFIDHLTNWYIRRSRRRFWRSARDPAARADKAAAYATLYEVLVTFSRVMAPFLPFMTEAMYQDLVVHPGMASPGKDSVHLCDYPAIETAKLDSELEAEVALVRQVASMCRALREKHKIKTRQPLARLMIVHHDSAVHRALERCLELLADEVNVNEVSLKDDDADLCTLTIKANFRSLGQRLGPKMKEVAAAIAGFSREQWHRLQSGATFSIAGEAIGKEDVVVSRSPRGDVVIETEGALTVALDTHLDEELLREGLVREVVSRIQKSRKEAGLEFTDRIELTLYCDEPLLLDALKRNRDHIAEELLAVRFESVRAAPAPGMTVLDIEGHRLGLALKKA